MVRVAVFLLTLLLPGLATAAGPLPDAVYTATAHVTGTEEPERSRGMRDGLTEVLIKVSGRPDLAGDSRLAPLLAAPGALVSAFTYEDKMKGIPVHDEQGTRERPHYLHLTFQRAAVDQALAGLGLAPWPAPRPTVGLWLAVHDGLGAYVLARSGERGFAQRWAAEAASTRRGLPLLLPEPLLAARIGPAAVDGQNLTALRRATPSPAVALLVGRLDQNPDTGLWHVAWTLDRPGGRLGWDMDGITFDAAIQAGVDGAIRALRP